MALFLVVSSVSGCGVHTVVTTHIRVDAISPIQLHSEASLDYTPTLFLQQVGTNTTALSLPGVLVDSMLSVEVQANTLATNTLYEVGVKDENGDTRCFLNAQPIYAFTSPMLDESTTQGTFHVAGGDEIEINATGLFVTSNVLVRFESFFQSGVVKSSSGTLVIKTTTPPIDVPADWRLRCGDPIVKGGDCVPDIVLDLDVSFDLGVSWTNSISITFAYAPPLKAAFLLLSGVGDFGWTHQINQGRVKLEAQYGSRINATVYIENLPEGEFASGQDEKGFTFEKGIEGKSHLVFYVINVCLKC